MDVFELTEAAEMIKLQMNKLKKLEQEIRTRIASSTCRGFWVDEAESRYATAPAVGQLLEDGEVGTELLRVELWGGHCHPPRVARRDPATGGPGIVAHL